MSVRVVAEPLRLSAPIGLRPGLVSGLVAPTVEMRPEDEDMPTLRLMSRVDDMVARSSSFKVVCMVEDLRGVLRPSQRGTHISCLTTGESLSL